LNDRVRVDRLHDWFALQLELAEVLAAKSGVPLEAAFTFYTNLCRRFGFDRPAPGVECAPQWTAFVRRLVTLQTTAERVALTADFAHERLPHWPTTAGRFGCFNFDPPRDGAVRIHFFPNDTEGGSGPLRRKKCAKRVDELATMFAFLRRNHPDARYVVGNSWLYNIEAYRRLFPPEYIASVKLHDAPRDLAGGSWWGQFIDHAGNVRADRARIFRERLRTLDPAALWKLFPMPAMSARAAVDVFYRYYAALGAGTRS
jgi:hypothetical protein